MPPTGTLSPPVDETVPRVPPTAIPTTEDISLEIWSLDFGDVVVADQNCKCAVCMGFEFSKVSARAGHERTSTRGDWGDGTLVVGFAPILIFP
jgi:hypothetical protein